MRIRTANSADYPAMLEIYSFYVRETAISFDLEPPKPEAFAAHLEHAAACCPCFVCEAEGTVVGYACAAPAFSKAAYDRCAEVTIYLAPSAQRRGWASALYDVLETALKDRDYRVLIACITADNERSIAFHRHHGFTESGALSDCGWKFGSWHSVVWLSKRIGGLSAPETRPIIGKETK